MSNYNLFILRKVVTRVFFWVWTDSFILTYFNYFGYKLFYVYTIQVRKFWFYRINKIINKMTVSPLVNMARQPLQMPNYIGAKIMYLKKCSQLQNKMHFLFPLHTNIRILLQIMMVNFQEILQYPNALFILKKIHLIYIFSIWVQFSCICLNSVSQLYI